MKALAAELPDVPRWVEVRSMLLSGEGRVIGSVSTSPLSFVVVDPVGTAGVVGRPASASVRAAAEVAHEILSVPEDAGWTATALPEWGREAATLYILGEHGRLPGFSEEEARLMTASELAAAPELPADLRDELMSEAKEGTLVGAFAEGRPVSFCYPASVTERWWDISIDTLGPFRRQGHAGRAVSCCVRLMERTGRRPVWGAVASNPASARLAEKLGFVATDSLIVFSREG